MKSIQQQLFTCQVLMCALMELSAEEYAALQYEMGLDFIKWYLPFDEKMQRILEGERMFWNWWKLCWSYRDEGMLKEDLKSIPVAKRREMYKSVHEEVAMELKPGKIITAILFKKTKKQTI